MDNRDRVNVVIYEPDSRRASEKVRDLQAGLGGALPEGYEVIDTGSKYRTSQKSGPVDLLKAGKIDLVLLDPQTSGAETMLDDLVLEAATSGLKMPKIVILTNHPNGELTNYDARMREFLYDKTPGIASVTLTRRDGYLDARDLPRIKAAVSTVYNGH
ncbi:hypothetical protein HYY69_02570 [Candidatus Woesearchaeota archaeon]|nr:hypothetical protein [Candidatus Woesearchaeota archaeon]